ncbi:type II secretion system protein [Colwellia echini]|uniref:Type II secretion system protein n=1 Tax=Colwellia echini TaxID=1982103 RepID=A0ABY3N0X1_9GAMM|nr:type II secretion system protein [Colwellia echini]TYK67146.1 type II secretion system protein [Colwellia echini]
MIDNNSHNKFSSNIRAKALTGHNKNAGFTLIELVIVVVILGFLAATAIPKFVDLTGQAKQANIEGMAGGFATGVSLARAQWEAEARPKDTSNLNMVNYDGTVVYLTSEDRTTTPAISPGYIVGITSGNGINGVGSNITVSDCIDIWNSLLQQPPAITSDIDDVNGSDNSIKYLANLSGSGAATLCHYHLKETLARDGDGDYTAPATTSVDTLTSVGNSFSYQPANSSVIIYINDN